MTSKKTLTISNINFTDKWTEFWFEEEKSINEDGWDVWLHCCKTYMLQEKVEESDLTNHVLKHGYIGLTTEWVYQNPSWNLEKVYRDSPKKKEKANLISTTTDRVEKYHKQGWHIICVDKDDRKMIHESDDFDWIENDYYILDDPKTLDVIEMINKLIEKHKDDFDNHTLYGVPMTDLHEDQLRVMVCLSRS